MHNTKDYTTYSLAGKVCDLPVFDLDANGAHLNTPEQPVLLTARDCPDWVKPGDQLRVFVYTDRNKLVASMEYPKVLLGDYGWLKCTDVSDIGAFFDWGLRKNLFVPKALLNKEVAMGQYYMVKVTKDRVDGRLIGTLRVKEMVDGPLERPIEPGESVTAVIAAATERAYFCIVNNRYGGWLHKKEVYEDVTLGEKHEMFVRKWITTDRVFELSLSPDGYEAVKKAMPLLYNHLRKAGGFLPYHDGTDAKVIELKFHMSKRKFKQAIGGLQRMGKVKLSGEGIEMIGKLPKREPKPEYVPRPQFDTPEPESTPVKKFRTRKNRD